MLCCYQKIVICTFFHQPPNRKPNRFHNANFDKEAEFSEIPRPFLGKCKCGNLVVVDIRGSAVSPAEILGMSAGLQVVRNETEPHSIVRWSNTCPARSPGNPAVLFVPRDLLTRNGTIMDSTHQLVGGWISLAKVEKTERPWVTRHVDFLNKQQEALKEATAWSPLVQENFWASYGSNLSRSCRLQKLYSLQKPFGERLEHKAIAAVFDGLWCVLMPCCSIIIQKLAVSGSAATPARRPQSTWLLKLQTQRRFVRSLLVCFRYRGFLCVYLFACVQPCLFLTSLRLPDSPSAFERRLKEVLICVTLGSLNAKPDTYSPFYLISNSDQRFRCIAIEVSGYQSHGIPVLVGRTHLFCVLQKLFLVWKWD